MSTVHRAACLRVAIVGCLMVSSLSSFVQVLEHVAYRRTIPNDFAREEAARDPADRGRTENGGLTRDLADRRRDPADRA